MEGRTVTIYSPAVPVDVIRIRSYAARVIVRDAHESTGSAPQQLLLPRASHQTILIMNVTKSHLVVVKPTEGETVNGNASFTIPPAKFAVFIADKRKGWAAAL